MILDWKSSQQYPVNAGVPQELILGPTLFLPYINDLPDDVICSIAIYADDTTVYTKYDQTLICSKKLKLSSEHCGLGRKWLVDFNAGKIQLASFDRSNTTGAIDAKIDESVLEEQ